MLVFKTLWSLICEDTKHILFIVTLFIYHVETGYRKKTAESATVGVSHTVSFMSVRPISFKEMFKND